MTTKRKSKRIVYRTKTQECNRGTCHNKINVGYCYECFKRENMRVVKLKVWMLFTIPILIAIILAIPYFLTNIDEAGFCEDKLKTHFPEYEFTDVDYTESGDILSCTGKHTQIIGEQRDGLMLLDAKIEEEKTFRLTDDNDIRYLKSDDWTEDNAMFSVAILVILVFIAIIIKEINEV